MKLPRDLSGAELSHVLCKYFDYRRLHKEGSHIILQTETPKHHRLSVPDHKPLRIGTLNAILRAVVTVKEIEKEEILSRI